MYATHPCAKYGKPMSIGQCQCLDNLVEVLVSERNIIMNAEQELARKIIKPGHNLILTGQAGSGKTYTIQNTYKQLLNSH